MTAAPLFLSNKVSYDPETGIEAFPWIPQYNREENHEK
jgi:hypothetical protein